MVRKRRSTYFSAKSRGFTLFELIIVLALLSILGGIAISNLRTLATPTQNAAAALTGFVKQVRARAIASTNAYRIRPTSNTYIVGEYAATCAATTWAADTRNRLSLPNGSRLIDRTWDICFNSRGFPDGNLDVALVDTTGQARTVEILLGGATRVK